MGHGLHEGCDEMADMLQLSLWQIEDLIGAVKIKVPRARCQLSLVRRPGGNGNGAGQQEDGRGEARTVGQQPHQLAAQQENRRVLG